MTASPTARQWRWPASVVLTRYDTVLYHNTHLPSPQCHEGSPAPPLIVNVSQTPLPHRFRAPAALACHGADHDRGREGVSEGGWVTASAPRDGSGSGACQRAPPDGRRPSS